MPTHRLLRFLGAASLLVATARLIGSGRRRPHDPTQEYVKAGNADESSYEPREEKRSKRVTPHRDPDNRSNPADERHQRCERRYWIITGITSVVATLATAVAAGFAIGAYNASWQAVGAAQEQAEIARRALIASNRAWLDLKVEIASDLKPQSDGENIAVRISAQNFGHSPAIGAYLSMEFHANHLFEGAPDSALKKSCNYGNTERLRNLTAAGRLIVPGGSYVWERSDVASPEDIGEAIKTIEPSAGRFFPTSFMPIMSVLICVTYATPEDSVLHQTALQREVYRKSPTNKETGMAALTRGVTIPKTELGLSDFLPGDYAN